MADNLTDENDAIATVNLLKQVFGQKPSDSTAEDVLRVMKQLKTAQAPEPLFNLKEDLGTNLRNLPGRLLSVAKETPFEIYSSPTTRLVHEPVKTSAIDEFAKVSRAMNYLKPSDKVQTALDIAKGKEDIKNKMTIAEAQKLGSLVNFTKDPKRVSQLLNKGAYVVSLYKDDKETKIGQRYLVPKGSLQKSNPPSWWKGTPVRVAPGKLRIWTEGRGTEIIDDKSYKRPGDKKKENRYSKVDTLLNKSDIKPIEGK